MRVVALPQKAVLSYHDVQYLDQNSPKQPRSDFWIRIILESQDLDPYDGIVHSFGLQDPINYLVYI